MQIDFSRRLLFSIIFKKAVIFEEWMYTVMRKIMYNLWKTYTIVLLNQIFIFTKQNKMYNSFIELHIKMHYLVNLLKSKDYSFNS